MSRDFIEKDTVSSSKTNIIYDQFGLVPDNEYYILHGICPYCEGYGTEVACNGSRMVPCSHPQCSNGRLIDSKNKS